ncbi:hypothetical protein ELE36_13400 [Pseudolysobacter antarcticus]|uniref:Uncharacterized protein n=1 Tax=Pseudolysobacter antarcticus TaxID=2511995 RepID=A0A411HL63_9GAMM|nr:hypothetical protein [Pseudolysobacter antarcticus]QBB71269.1 hypothetical protein ELE36_13400 [Pseudolysobacter antarcticus]
MPISTSVRIVAWMENAWLVRYLDRQLSDDEVAAFEAYVLDKPELLTLIEADTNLRDALSDAALNTPGDVLDQHAASDARAYVTDIQQPLPSMSTSAHGIRPAWVSIAASLLLGLGMGWIGERVWSPDHSQALIANPTRIIYDTLRGEASPPRIEHADSNSNYVLVEIAVPPEAKEIILNIENSAEQTFTESPDGFISALINKHALTHAQSIFLRYRLKGITQQRTLSLTEFKRGES